MGADSILRMPRGHRNDEVPSKRNPSEAEMNDKQTMRLSGPNDHMPHQMPSLMTHGFAGRSIKFSQIRRPRKSARSEDWDE